MKKILTLLMLALFAAPQFIFAASQQQLASDEIKANINSSLAQAQEEARHRDKLLLKAVSSKEPQPFKVLALLELGADVNARTENNETPLYLASQRGHLNIVHILLDQKDIIVDAKDKNNLTPLLIASKNGHLEVVKYLIKKQANPNILTKSDKFNALLLAVWNNQKSTALYLIDNTNVNLDQQNAYGYTALLMCASKYMVYDEMGTSAGQFKDGDKLEIAKALISKGANVNLKNKQGKSALLLAVQNDKKAIASALLKKDGIIVNTTDNDGNTALHFVKSFYTQQQILTKNAINVNAKNKYGATPLMYAAQTTTPKLVETLINAPYNADVNATDNYGANALVYAIHESCNPEIIKMLVNKGINTTKYKDEYGRTIKDLLTPNQEGKPRYLDVQCDDVSAIRDIVFPKK